jgi:hypothetical protein
LDWGWYAVVGEWVMDSRRQRAAHNADVNWAPLSLVIVEGTPKSCTHPTRRASAQAAAVMEASGTASGQRVVLSMIVKR